METQRRDALVFEELGKTYRLGLRARRVDALSALDLRVEEGAVYGFVGPNGAGKSTTIKILVGLIGPTSGRAFILGRPATDPGSRAAIGYLPENPSFHDFLRPLEVLSYMGRLSGLSGRALHARAEALLERVGLSRARDLTVRKFSKGMVQRLGLAQALLHDPPILVLDEPMSGLDPLGRKEVRDLIVDLGRAGKTIFFSTHILSDVETICDRVGMLLHGKLVREGPLQSLLDGTIRAVEVRCDALPARVVEQLCGVARDVRRAPDGITFTFATVDAANAGVQTVHGAGGRVIAVQPDRETLEETFVRLAQATTSASEPVQRIARG